MIYKIEDTPPLGKMLLFSLQMLLSVFVATVLIAQICGVSVSGALVGAALSTLSYGVITGHKSPMFLSNSGAFVAPVLFALGLGGYTGVAIGGLVACFTYCIFGLCFAHIPYQSIYKIFPPALIGAVTVIIGVNLMGFIPTYLGETGQWGVVIAFITMISIALISHYGKGLMRILPFLLGTLVGYICAAILTITKICPLIDFNIFKGIHFISLPDLAFSHWKPINISAILPIVIMFVAYTISAMMEALSDHAALSGIIDVDLYKEPGLTRIFIGEGFGNLISSCFGGLGSCSYGESVATIGFSRVCSVRVTMVAAVMLGLLGFVEPVQVFIASIPSCVFAGAAVILYGFIACSGIKMLQKVNLTNQKELIMVSVVLSLGVGGVVVGGETISFSATALGLIAGVILNVVLKDEKAV